MRIIGGAKSMRLQKLSMSSVCAVHHLFHQSNRLPFILLLYFLHLAHTISEMVALLLPVKARLWFTLAHTSSQIGLPTNRLRHGSSDSLHFLPTAAGYARYELNQLVYRLILMLILILILYSISPTPNRFFFLPKS